MDIPEILITGAMFVLVAGFALGFVLDRWTDNREVSRRLDELEKYWRDTHEPDK